MSALDFCTLAPDAIGSNIIAGCCFAHDTAYSLAQTLADKLSADNQLAACIAGYDGWYMKPIAWVYGAAVTLFGGYFWLKARRKMQISSTQLERMIGGKVSTVQRSNMRSVQAGLDAMGNQLGVNTAQRLAQYLAQLIHESGSFRFDREIWDGKGAQAGYDTRTDLGNTAAVDGDGELYKGRSPIQVTGKDNYLKFFKWCKELGLNPPDFVANPDLINSDPWEGLAPLWYWSTRKLNALADAGNIEMITQRINGGRNGFDDRCRAYARVALVLLGRPADALRQFQRDMHLEPDGVAGPLTRAALHGALGALEGRASAEGPGKATITSVQTRLRALGYPEVGNVDGRMGDKTETAILAFRNRAGLPLVPAIDDALLAALMTATPRPVSEERATATVADLKDAPSVRKGLQLEKLAQAGIAVTGLGGVLNGTASAEDIYEAYNKWQAFKAFAGSMSPWLIGLGVAGVAWYLSRDFIAEQVRAYRQGRHV